MAQKYVLNTVTTYRVPTEKDALALRDELANNSYGELESFSYQIKFIKAKGEVIEEYYVVKAKMKVNDEKEPESKTDVVLTPEDATKPGEMEYDERF